MLSSSLLHRQTFIPPSAIMTGDGSARKIRALINTRDRDLHETVVLPSGMAPVTRPLSLLQNHSVDKVIGRVDSVDQEDDGITVEATVVDERAWQLVQSGALQGVSIGFVANEIDRDTITRWTLVEVSLTPVASNGAARILEVREMSEGDNKGQVIDLVPTVIREQPARSTSWRTGLPGAPYLRRGEIPKFSLRAVVESMANGTALQGLEREVVDEYGERTSSLETRGVRVPSSVFHTRQIASSPPISPDAFLQSMLDETSAARRWGQHAMRLGLTTIGSDREQVFIPSITQGLTGEFGDKDHDATETEMLFDRVALGPKYVSAGAIVRRSALKYGDPQIDTLVRDDLTRALDDRTDTAVLWGNPQVQAASPQGIFTQIPGPLTVAVNGELTPPALFRLKQLLAQTWRTDNPTTEFRWSTHFSLIDRLRTTSKKVMPSGSDGEWFSGVMPFDSGEGILLGIPLATSGRYPVDLGTPTSPRYNLHLVYGAAVVFILFGGVDLYLDASTLAHAGALRLYAFLDVNIVKRDPNAVAVLTGCEGTVFPVP